MKFQLRKEWLHITLHPSSNVDPASYETTCKTSE